MRKIRVGAWRDDSIRADAGRLRRRSARSGSTTKRRPPHGSTRRCQAFLDWFNGEDDDRSGPESRAGASLVRHHPPVRRRQRPHRARDRRHGAGAFRKQPAALLQHVGADPAGAQRLLRHPGSDAEGRLWTSRPGWNGFSAALAAPSTARRQPSQRVSRKRGSGKATPATSLNDRQRDVVNRLLDGFEGKLTSSKWAKLRKCSQDTALRDIDDLVERGILAKDEGGGRSTSYSLADVQAG